MEIRNHSTDMVLGPALKEALKMVRKERNFAPATYVDEKINLLNAYYRQAGLKSAVVAVSGGIDSAVVLGIVDMASRQEDSPIQNVIAITMPDRQNEGVTGQDEAASLAEEVCEEFGVRFFEVNMSAITDAIIKEVELYSGIGLPKEDKEDWCRGQVTSYARTPTYYYVTSVLAAQGKPGLVIGTTNLSEGGYLGYFGKASDGMVDIQLISDLFKSEVYEVGRLLGVPQAVLDRAPTGDMFDATTDEVVFGAPYDFVELFTHMKWDANACAMVDQCMEELASEDEHRQYDEFVENLERMHRYNAHKYLGRSPAVHLDILQTGVTNGWNNPAWRPE
jgi:NAD+ synthetase